MIEKESIFFFFPYDGKQQVYVSMEFDVNMMWQQSNPWIHSRERVSLY